MKRKEKYLVEINDFLSNALAIIKTMLQLNASRQDGDTQLVEEILHSIFFLGRIMTPPLSPEKIVLDTDYLAGLKKQFPLPFEPSSFSQLPRRSPFSCVLDMIVFLEGPEKERQEKEGQEKEGPEKVDEIIKKLREIIRPLNQKLLVPYTICVSQNKNNQNSVCRYYGVSMSRMWPDLCHIMISASCLKYWDSYVAGAVMTYHPNVTKDPRFDGTIRLPEQVTCETFKLFKVGKLLPCIKCQNMFGLKEIDPAEGASAESRIAARSSHASSTSTAPPLDKDKTFPYGNCAEVESLSNLFKKDSEVREQARPTSEMGTDGNREMAAERVRADLKECLKEKHSFTWDDTFYNPQL